MKLENEHKRNVRSVMECIGMRKLSVEHEMEWSESKRGN